MGFQSVINIILPRRFSHGIDYRASVTHSAKGERQGYYATRPGRIHGGVDINYHYIFGYTLGQNSINLEHPAVGSPASGLVTDTQANWGMIEITDVQKYEHQIRHLNSINAAITKNVTYVYAGQYIGDMGGKGPDGTDQFGQHVHYSVLTQENKGITGDSGNFIDPEDFWDNNLYYIINAGSLNHIPLVPTNQLVSETQSLFKGLSQGLNINGNGETLRREGNHIWRIEKDGTTRGWFISE